MLADRGRTTLKDIPEPVQIVQVSAQGAMPEGAKRFLPESAPTDDGARVVGIVAPCMGFGGVIVSLLVSSLRHDTISFVLAIAACLVDFTAAGMSDRNTGTSALLFVVSALVLALTIGWSAILAAPLCLITAGMTYYRRARS
ncbi:MAG: hypothetical protein PVSMB7_23420 [Chloroflexota bacterium]